jgi:hypothetical protein
VVHRARTSCFELGRSVVQTSGRRLNSLTRWWRICLLAYVGIWFDWLFWLNFSYFPQSVRANARNLRTGHDRLLPSFISPYHRPQSTLYSLRCRCSFVKFPHKQLGKKHPEACYVLSLIRADVLWYLPTSQLKNWGSFASEETSYGSGGRGLIISQAVTLRHPVQADSVTHPIRGGSVPGGSATGTLNWPLLAIWCRD